MAPELRRNILRAGCHRLPLHRAAGRGGREGWDLSLGSAGLLRAAPFSAAHADTEGEGWDVTPLCTQLELDTATSPSPPPQGSTLHGSQ